MLNEQMARGVGPARINIAYEQRGDAADPPVLLIMGLGAQLVHWSIGFLDALVARGLFVIRFDNRDAGRSSHFSNAPRADLAAALAGDFSSAAYTLSDMAVDAVGLLDALNIGAAHIVGASLAGYIAQAIAIAHPHRILSLTSMMASTGDASVGQCHADIRAAIFGGPPVAAREEFISRALRIAPFIRSQTDQTAPEEIAATAGAAWDRGYDNAAVARQGVAAIAGGDLTAKLCFVAAPTLVVHGLDDRLCDPSGGRATAAAIPNAELMLVQGMAHDLPRAVWSPIADRISARVKSAEDRRTTRLRDE